ncbi:MAG: hypothetical protein ACYTHM_15695 [Planctomycetota bacterium]
MKMTKDRRSVRAKIRSSSMPRRMGPLGCLALLAFAGCGLSRPVLVSEDPEILRVKKELAAPIGWRIEVAPVKMALARELKEDDEWVLSMDPIRLQEETAEALSATGLFKGVWAAGASGREVPDLRLKLKVTAAVGRFKGTNGYLPLQMALWWGFSSLIGCFVADEEYAASMETIVTLEEVATGKSVWSGTLKADFQGALDHYQKGLEIWDLIPPGTFLAGYDPEKVSANLAPHLFRKLHIALARRLVSEITPPAVDACVVCISRTRPAEGEDQAEDARKDVQKFLQAFSKGRKRVEIIDLSDRLSAHALRNALSALTARRDIRIRDLVFYAAGKGTVSPKGKSALRPALPFPTRKGFTAVPLETILKTFAKVPAASRAVVIDAGFLGDSPRSAKPRGPLPEGALIQFPEGEKFPGFISPAREAIEGEAFGGGMLTHFLTEAVLPQADTDADGTLTLSEVYDHISWNVARAARRAGGEGLLILSGDGVLFRIQQSESKSE